LDPYSNFPNPTLPKSKEFSPLGFYHDGKEELLLFSSSREQRERMYDKSFV
jgi:hypothetical protein